MDEKIKVSLPQNVLDALKKDCGDFKIVKANGQPNMNAFINTLIVNFYQTFSAAEESFQQSVKNALALIPERYRETAFLDVIKIAAKKGELQEDKKQTTTFSFKPTKNSKQALLHIEEILLQSESLSSFYRRLFTAYVQKTKNEREKIIHKDVFVLLQKAIKQKLAVSLRLQSGTIFNHLSVYAIAPAKDELFNYVLGYNNKNNITLRLASVETVSLSSESSYIPEENQRLFERQIACAAQFPIYNTDNEPIQVQLTEKGKKLFDKIYLYRPSPISIQGDVYTFDCSANQLIYYFERFGENALILSPKKLGIFMRNYYHFALKKYKTIYKEQ